VERHDLIQARHARPGLPTSAMRDASIASWSTRLTCRFVRSLKSRPVMPALVPYAFVTAVVRSLPRMSGAEPSARRLSWDSEAASDIPESALPSATSIES
jgi:hypothetical protein